MKDRKISIRLSLAVKLLRLLKSVVDDLYKVLMQSLEDSLDEQGK